MLPILGDVISSALSVIDDVHTSEDEKLAAKAKLLDIQTANSNRVLQYQAEIAEQQAKTIRTEAASGHWLATNWRPIVMLTFAGLMCAHWLGFTPENLDQTEVMGLLGIIKLGLGGYVIGRSAEKVLPATVAAMKSRERT